MRRLLLPSEVDGVGKRFRPGSRAVACSWPGRVASECGSRLIPIPRETSSRIRSRVSLVTQNAMFGVNPRRAANRSNVERIVAPSGNRDEGFLFELPGRPLSLVWVAKGCTRSAAPRRAARRQSGATRDHAVPKQRNFRDKAEGRSHLGRRRSATHDAPAPRALSARCLDVAHESRTGDGGHIQSGRRRLCGPKGKMTAREFASISVASARGDFQLRQGSTARAQPNAGRAAVICTRREGSIYQGGSPARLRAYGSDGREQAWATFARAAALVKLSSLRERDEVSKLAYLHAGMIWKQGHLCLCLGFSS